MLVFDQNDTQGVNSQKKQPKKTVESVTSNVQ